MTKTLEEILTKLEKDFSELKQYALKLEAENCMLRKKLGIEDEDIPDNCIMTVQDALDSVYFKNRYRSRTGLKNRILKSLGNNSEKYISEFNGTKFSETLTTSGCGLETRLIWVAILEHYNVHLDMDIENDKKMSNIAKEMFHATLERCRYCIEFK